MKRVAEFVIYSNLYAVILIAALTFQSYHVFGVEGSFFKPEVLIVITATLFLYPLHRILGLKGIPEAQKMERHLFAESHSTIIWVFVGLGLVSSIGLLFLIDLKKLWVHVPIAVISLAYVFPIIPSRVGWIKLREVPFAKPVFIGIAVAYLTTVFPFLHEVDSGALWSLFLAKTFFLIAITLPFDIRDYGADKQAGLPTLPVKLGIEKARKIALLSNVLFTGMNFLAFFFFEAYALPVFFALWASEVYADVWIKKSTPIQSETWYAFAIEGTILVQTVLVLLGVLATRVFF